MLIGYPSPPPPPQTTTTGSTPWNRLLSCTEQKEQIILKIQCLQVDDGHFGKGSVEGMQLTSERKKRKKQYQFPVELMLYKLYIVQARVFARLGQKVL